MRAEEARCRLNSLTDFANQASCIKDLVVTIINAHIKRTGARFVINMGGQFGFMNCVLFIFLCFLGLVKCWTLSPEFFFVCIGHTF